MRNTSPASLPTTVRRSEKLQAKREAQWEEQLARLSSIPGNTVERIEKSHTQFWAMMDFIDEEPSLFRTRGDVPIRPPLPPPPVRQGEGVFAAQRRSDTRLALVGATLVLAGVSGLAVLLWRMVHPEFPALEALWPH